MFVILEHSGESLTLIFSQGKWEFQFIKETMFWLCLIRLVLLKNHFGNFTYYYSFVLKLFLKILEKIKISKKMTKSKSEKNMKAC